MTSTVTTRPWSHGTISAAGMRALKVTTPTAVLHGMSSFSSASHCCSDSRISGVTWSHSAMGQLQDTTNATHRGK